MRERVLRLLAQVDCGSHSLGPGTALATICLASRTASYYFFTFLAIPMPLLFLSYHSVFQLFPIHSRAYFIVYPLVSLPLIAIDDTSTVYFRIVMCPFCVFLDAYRVL